MASSARGTRFAGTWRRGAALFAGSAGRIAAAWAVCAGAGSGNTGSRSFEAAPGGDAPPSALAIRGPAPPVRVRSGPLDNDAACCEGWGLATSNPAPIKPATTAASARPLHNGFGGVDAASSND
jgi:hypothetical protein